MEGWLKLHRKMLEWEWYEDPNAKVLFLHCLLKANFKDKLWRGKVIERGSFFTSTDNLAKELRISVKQIRTSLGKLKRTNEIEVRGTNNGSFIKVCNYDHYQILDDEEGQATGPAPRQTEGKQGASKGQQHKKERKKEGKNKEETIREELKKYDWINSLFLDSIVEWLSYKAEKRQTYKSERSLKTFHKSLLNLSNNDPGRAKAIIEQSMANNWAGIFELKNVTNGNQEIKGKTWDSSKTEQSTDWLIERMAQEHKRQTGEELPDVS